jgi:hypothetical protein
MQPSYLNILVSGSAKIYKGRRLWVTNVSEGGKSLFNTFNTELSLYTFGIPLVINKTKKLLEIIL